MVQIYRKKWQRGLIKSFFGYLRDWIILVLPIKKVPASIVKILYGTNFNFAFLVHPRAYQDVFISMPAFKPIKFFLGKKSGFHFFSKTTPFILNCVETEQNVNGCVIAQLTVPEIMFERRKETLRNLEKCIDLVSKICSGTPVAGLGGWFPMVTKRGANLESYAIQKGVTVTNGHCGTLSSIYMTMEKILEIGQLSMSQLELAIIGVGKMGTNVARAFNGKIRRLVLIDTNRVQLNKVKSELEKTNNTTLVECVALDSSTDIKIKDILKSCHAAVCATSSFRNILKLKDLPLNFIAIDDSRPEALPRDPKNERIILEGGLLKIKNAKINYNFGFGQDDNVFGCLGEAFLLALDQGQLLRPTLGDVSVENFFNMLEFCKKNGVTEGDFKSSNSVVRYEDIKNALDSRKDSLYSK